MARTPDDVSGGLGDITGVIREQGVADLRWLDVDPEEYRRLEALPKQNLDMIPEVQGALAWDGVDSRVPSLIPVRPHATVNANPLDAPEATLRSNSSVRDRMAEYMIEGLSDKEIAKKLSLQFSPDQLRAASAEANDLISQRGLLGNVYVDSEHFPRCAQEGPHRELVAKHAKRALFVLAKDRCSGCVHNRGGRCASFQKYVVSEVPYQRVAAHYASQLSSEHRLSEDDVRHLPAASVVEVRDRLRVAFQRPVVSLNPDGVQRVRHQDRAVSPAVTDADRAAYAARRAAEAAREPLPGPMFLVASRRVMQGHADAASLSASSVAEIRRLAAEVGVLGHTYLDGDALGGPAAALKFCASLPSVPDYVVFRRLAAADAATPEYVELSKITRVSSFVEEPSREHLGRALERAVAEGRLGAEQASQVAANVSSAPDGYDWRGLLSQVNLYSPPSEGRAVDPMAPSLVVPHYGSQPADYAPRPMDPEEVRRSISKMMNDGLSGRRLQASILRRYARQDLARVPQVGESLSANDGIQGSYFVDPTAYSDYGRGCSEGSERFRRDTRVPNVFASSSCTGCRLQTHPGWCSKYAKTLIRQVPESVVAAAAERRRLPVVQPSAPVENPVAKYELSAELPVDLGSPARKAPEISLSSPSVTD